MAAKKRSLAGPGSAGSIKKTKDQLKKGSGNRTISGVPANSNIIVRFLTEPGEWFGYHEVYDEELKEFYPLLAGMTEGHKGEKSSFRYLANAVITDSEYEQDINKVVALRLPKTLANQLILKYDKFGTLTDRDYDLTRSGERFDTVYDATPEAPSKFAFKKYEPKDLEETLLKAYDEVWADDDDEDEEEEEVKSAPKKRSRRKPEPEPEPEEEDEDDDEPDDDEDEVEDDEVEEEEDDEEPEAEDEPEDDEDAYTEEELLALGIAELRELADDYDITLTPTQRKSKRKIVDAIMAEAEEV